MLQKPPVEPPPQSVGCKYCVVGHVPTWRHDTQEYVHVIQVKSADGLSTQVTSASCVAFKKETASG